MQFFRREMKIIAEKFAYVKDTLYLCIVKRPTPDPSRQGGGRPPGDGKVASQNEKHSL